MKVAYIRVSSVEQHTDRQYDQAMKDGCEKIYEEKISGKNTDRPQLKECLNFLREGDTLWVAEISRLARNTHDLLNIVDTLDMRGITLISKKESIDTSNAYGRFLLSVFGAMAELEREYILSRQREGIEIAKAKGNVYKGRKPRDLGEGFDEAVKDWKAKKRTATSIMKEFDISAPTFYERVKKMD